MSVLGSVVGIRSASSALAKHALLLVVLAVAACGGVRKPGTVGDSLGGASGTGGSASGTGASGSGASSAGTNGTAGTRAGSAGTAGGTAGTGTGGAAGTASGTGSTASTGPCNTPTTGVMGGCAGNYPSTTVEALRKAPLTGCYELLHVGLVARTDSPTEPRLFVQDVGGGDFSALFAKCSSTGTHACAAPVLAKLKGLYDTMQEGAQISVRGYYQYSSADGFEGFYIEDILDECTHVARPAPISLTLSEITRDARTPAKWFRRATITIPSADPLVMYDFSPAELKLAAPTCPDWLGFAMIPKSAGTTAPAACMATTQPAGRTADPREIFIGRQFFNQFLFNADCACPGGKKQQVTAASSVSGTVTGYLIIEHDLSQTNGYQVFDAAADLVFPLKLN